MKLIERIFSIKNDPDGVHKIITVLGLKLKIKKPANCADISLQIKDLHNELNRNMQKNLCICNQHQRVFTKYKNVNAGKSVVLVATGPTLENFEKIDNCLYLACNHAFMRKGLKYNYLFMQDFESVNDCIEKVPDYIDKNCELFYGLTMEHQYDVQRVIPESLAIRHNANRYYTDWANIKRFKSQFTYDISAQPLGCFSSVVFPALQFLLWTNPKRIYLVGCDCSVGHYISTRFDDLDMSFLVEAWEKFKVFSNRYYPETEIISVNPVGLKGMFKDVYTRSYAEKNGINDVEILSFDGDYANEIV